MPETFEEKLDALIDAVSRAHAKGYGYVGDERAALVAHVEALEAERDRMRKAMKDAVLAEEFADATGMGDGGMAVIKAALATEAGGE